MIEIFERWKNPGDAGLSAAGRISGLAAHGTVLGAAADKGVSEKRRAAAGGAQFYATARGNALTPPYSLLLLGTIFMKDNRRLIVRKV